MCQEDHTDHGGGVVVVTQVTGGGLPSSSYVLRPPLTPMT